jgi:NDP-sugar pyrophosphorylase family protein
MQAVILVAGKGKRMKHLTKNSAKPMLKIKGKPILEYKINALPKKVKEVIFVVSHCSEQIMKHFKKKFNGRKITYVFQNRLNGTAGALHTAKCILKDKFLVMNGDDLYRKKDLINIIKHDFAVLAYEVEDPRLYAVIKKNQSGNVMEIIEKPKNKKNKLTNIGVYVLNKKFFDYDLVPIGKGEFGLPQTIAKMAKDCKVKVVKATAWHPIGNPEDLKKAEEVIKKFV